MMCWYLLPLPRASKLLSTPTPSGPKQLFSHIVTGPPPFSCSLSELELHGSGFDAGFQLQPWASQCTSVTLTFCICEVGCDTSIFEIRYCCVYTAAFSLFFGSSSPPTAIPSDHISLLLAPLLCSAFQEERIFLGSRPTPWRL